MTQDKEKEEVLGQYLMLWIDDLRAGRSPELTERALKELTESQIHDLMATARFIKAVNFPTEHWQGQSDAIRARLEHRLVEMRRKQLAEGLASVISSNSFAECLHTARTKLGTTIDDLSNATGIQKSLLADVETGGRSPIRVPVEKMSELLSRLYMAFYQTVDLIRDSAQNWTLETFPNGQTQLGRMGRDLSPEARRQTLESGNISNVDFDMQRELQRVDEYAQALRQCIQGQLPKS